MSSAKDVLGPLSRGVNGGPPSPPASSRLERMLRREGVVVGGVLVARHGRKSASGDSTLGPVSLFASGYLLV